MNASSEQADTPRARAVEQTLAVCRHRWEVSGVSDADVRDMLDELRTHLTEATARGRGVEAVVGPDLEQFAREWAHARASRGQRIRRQAAYVLITITTLTLMRHLFGTSTVVAVTPGYLFFLVAFSAILLSWRPRRRALNFPRQFIASALLLLPAVAIDGWLVPDTTLFHVPLWITALLAAVTIAVFVWDVRHSAVTRSDRQPQV